MKIFTKRTTLAILILSTSNAYSQPRVEIGACEYVQKLSEDFAAAKANKVAVKEFQLLQSLAFSGIGTKFKADALYNLAKLPHVTWGMAQLESNIDQLMRKPIDMPSIDGFMLLAKKAYEEGKLSATSYRLLQSMNSVGMNSVLRSKRAGAIQDQIDASYSGAISGEAKSLFDSKPYKDFLKASGLKSETFKTEDWENFKRWTLVLPLYSDGFSEERAQDIGQSLALIQAASLGGKPLAEQSCAWLLRERFLAQIISLLGTRGQPTLLANGQLNKSGWINESSRGEALYPTQDKANSFGHFVDEEWVIARLKGPVDLRQEFTQTSELLGFLKLSAFLSSNRAVGLWSIGEPQESGYALPLALLKLGFGTMAVNLKNVSENHLQVLPGGRIQLRDNTNENLVSLAWTALGLSRTLLSLRNPNAVERAALSANQIQDLVGPKGAQGKLYQLFTGTVIESLARRRASRYEIEVLYQFLVKAGDVLDNDYLRHLPRKPNPPKSN